MKILLDQLNFTVGALKDNCEKIAHAIEEGKKKGCDLVVTSELAITGYPPEDFLLLPHFIDAAEKALQELAKKTNGITAIIGTVRKNPHKGQKELFNSAAVCQNGKIIGYQDKTLLPTYDVFDERRYFEPAEKELHWTIAGKHVGITICEDIWKMPTYTKNPVLELAKEPLDLLINISSSPYHAGKLPVRIGVCSAAAKEGKCPLVLCNQVGGNDSIIFDGHSVAVNAKGELVHLAPGFVEWREIIDTDHLKAIPVPQDGIEEMKQALLLGIRDYFQKQGFTKACLGLSGGIDSALVAALATEALGKENVLGVAMPSRYSSEGSITDAEELAKNLGIEFKIISIEEPFKAYLELLNPYFEGKAPDTTEENLQARIRGMILMALSNKHGYIVLSTGNKSELALGYSTLYGDLCGGLAVISDLTKEQIYALSRHLNKDRQIIPKDSLTKPPSAELRPNQKDSDSLPPYPIVDAVLKDYIEQGLSPDKIASKHNFDIKVVNDLVKKIHASEYKRRQAPPGLRISEKAFSVGRHFPIVQGWTREKE